MFTFSALTPVTTPPEARYPNNPTWTTEITAEAQIRDFVVVAIELSSQIRDVEIGLTA